MDYKDSIIENKTFNIFKQFIYNVVLSICIILVGCLVLVYGFKFRPYNVLTPSMTPVYYPGDLVVVKSQDRYAVGDVLKFSQSAILPTVHRLVAIKTIDGKTYYICHGDAVTGNKGTWHKDIEARNRLDITDMNADDVKKMYSNEIGDVQMVLLTQVEGKVVCSLRNWGTYLDFISNHKLLFIAMVVGVWCVTSALQNELDIKKARRLL